MQLLKTTIAALLLNTFGVSATWTAYEEYLAMLPKHITKAPSSRPAITFEPHQPYYPFPNSPARSKICYVKSHNDMKTDDTPYILEALHECNNGGKAVFPQGTTYVIGTAMDLTFLEHIDLDIQAYIQFTNDTTYWMENGFYETYQNVTLFFKLGGEDVNIYGGGMLDGNGQIWYDLYAEDDLILRPVLVGIIGLETGSVSDLNLRYSPEYYNFIANSTSVVYQGISISGYSQNASVTADNTDGWDTYRSSNIVIQNCVVNNGDDCVSFKPNSTEILVQNMHCNGSHGISVGSLGQYVGEYDIVENVYVYNISMFNASDGARIKVWPGSPAELSGDLQGGGGTGKVNNITYDTMYVDDVDYAIEITQCYGQTNLTLCNEYPSLVTISDVNITNIHGTTSTEYEPISGYVECSSEDVCTNITLTDISVTAPDGAYNYFTCGDVDETTLYGINCTSTNDGYN